MSNFAKTVFRKNGFDKKLNPLEDLNFDADLEDIIENDAKEEEVITEDKELKDPTKDNIDIDEDLNYDNELGAVGEFAELNTLIDEGKLI
jgi:hypothetical protein